MIRKLIKRYRIPALLLKGKESSTQSELTLVILGSSTEVEYLAQVAFDGHYTKTSIGQIWSWAIPRLARKMHASADLLFIVNANVNMADTLKKYDNSFFFLPRFISGEVDFATAHLKMKKKGTKGDIKRIEKNHLELEVAKDRATFEDFYRTMYVPHITKTFGNTAAIVNEKIFLERSKDCELLLVTQHGKRIAGSVIVYEKGRARGWMTGIRNASDEYKKLGALSALYYFEIVHLEKRGFKGVHYGGSRPFLKDGALQYKRKWGMHFTGTIKTGFMLKALRDSEGTRAFLRNNPFVHAHGPGHRYYGAAFANESDRQSDTFIQSVHKLYYFPGMDHFVIHYFDRAADPDAIPPDLKPLIKLTTATGLLG